MYCGLLLSLLLPGVVDLKYKGKHSTDNIKNNWEKRRSINEKVETESEF